MQCFKRLLVITIFFSSTSQAQKISNDGNFIIAFLSTETNNGQYVIESTTSQSKIFLKGNAGNVSFTNDSKKIIYQLGDTLRIIDLNTWKEEILAILVEQFKIPEDGEGNWVAFRRLGPEKKVIVYDLKNKIRREYSDGQDFYFNKMGTALFINNFNGEKGAHFNQLRVIYFEDGVERKIWSEKFADIKGRIWSKDGKRMAFLVQKKINNTIANSVWYYSEKMEICNELVSDFSTGIDKGLIVSDDKTLFQFTPDGNKILFSLEKQDKRLEGSNLEFPNLNVWSYIDPVLQSQQISRMSNLENKDHYAAVVDIDKRALVQLQEKNDIIGLGSLNGLQISNDHILVYQFAGDLYSNSHQVPVGYLFAEYSWNSAARMNLYAVSFNDGSRKLLMNNINEGNLPYSKVSPSGKYVIYYSQGKKNYYSYNLATGANSNITKNLAISWALEKKWAIRSYNDVYAAGIVGWLQNDESVLIQDHYSDIWLFDLSGKISPRCITNHYAKRNSIQFDCSWLGKSIFESGEKVILKATNLTNQDEGLFLISVSESKDPLVLLMGQYSYNPLIQSTNNQKNLYFFERSSRSEAPAVFYTLDFKTFQKVETDNEVKRIGIKKEVLRWNLANGEKCYGVLYKPQDFDFKRKYPLIINYYEGVKDINKFVPLNPYAGETNSDINISDYVQSGYLIFVPDFKSHYILGGVGESILKVISSSVQYLYSLGFVNRKKIGLAGHSFGGYETNFIVTHSNNLFAAAYSGSGISDLISFSGSVENNPNGFSQASAVISGQFRIGVSLWQRPDLYLKNSPIFYADRVSTPLLIMHNDPDYSVPFLQSVEFFKALRSLGKKCWLIQYEGEEHTVDNDRNKKDLSKRMKQFFDHYLKDLPAPIWMTKGIPGKLKGTTLGYDYDTILKSPESVELIRNEQMLTPQQKVLLKNRTRVNNNGKIVDIMHEK